MGAHLYFQRLDITKLTVSAFYYNTTVISSTEIKKATLACTMLLFTTLQTV